MSLKVPITEQSADDKITQYLISQFVNIEQRFLKLDLHLDYLRQGGESIQKRLDYEKEESLATRKLNELILDSLKHIEHYLEEIFRQEEHNRINNSQEEDSD